jgi:hypothetical protein
MAATHNLLKRHNHRIAAAGPHPGSGAWLPPRRRPTDPFPDSHGRPQDFDGRRRNGLWKDTSTARYVWGGWNDVDHGCDPASGA